MNKEERLSQRMLLLCGCASLEAKGDLQRLDLAIREALAGGVSVNELKSAMDGVAPQFEGHKECAVFMGNTKEQVDYLCRWLEERNRSKGTAD